MNVSLFGVKVERVTINELSVTLGLKDNKGNAITLFFDSIDEVSDFSRSIRTWAKNKANIEWDEWEEINRPTLITDRQGFTTSGRGLE